MFDIEHKNKAIEFYNSKVKYPDKLYNEVIDILSGYYALQKPNKEDVKRLIIYIEKIKLLPNSHSSLFVLQSYLFDVLHYSFKSN